MIKTIKYIIHWLFGENSLFWKLFVRKKKEETLEPPEPKYIEVKTTKGNSISPFNLTINEKLFSEQNVGSYVIYRLYNYNEESNTADFFMIEQLEESVLMRPTTYKVYIKKRT